MTIPHHRVAGAQAPGRDEPVEQHHHDSRHDERDGDAEQLRQQSALEPDRLGRAPGEPCHDLGGDGDSDHREQERARAGDEDQVDELRPYGGPPAVRLDAECRLEPGPYRAHHPGRRPEEEDQRHEAERARRAREAGDGLPDRVASLPR